jgi:adenylate kinase family enzyme
MKFLPLENLGPRIVISGPSNSGKSTLNVAIGKKLDLPVIHLDLLYHLPNTNWVPRSKEEFTALHDAAIAGDRWVMDGNYFGTITQRLARATGIILLGSEPWRAAARNVRRTLFETKRRAGQLEGAQDSLKLEFFRFILFEQPRKRERDLTILRNSGLPMVTLNSMRELQALYRAWGLER